MISFRDVLKDALSKTGPDDISFLEKQLTDLELFFCDTAAMQLDAETIAASNGVYQMIKDRYDSLNAGQETFEKVKTDIFRSVQVTKADLDKYVAARDAYFTYAQERVA